MRKEPGKGTMGNKIYRAQGKRKHERGEYVLFLARYRQNKKCVARQTRSGWILEVEEVDKLEAVEVFCPTNISICIFAVGYQLVQSPDRIISSLD